MDAPEDADVSDDESEELPEEPEPLYPQVDAPEDADVSDDGSEELPEEPEPLYPQVDAPEGTNVSDDESEELPEEPEPVYPEEEVYEEAEPIDDGNEASWDEPLYPEENVYEDVQPIDNTSEDLWEEPEPLYPEEDVYEDAEPIDDGPEDLWEEPEEVYDVPLDDWTDEGNYSDEEADAGLSAGEIKSIQKRLVKLGWLSKGDYSAGMLDDATIYAISDFQSYVNSEYGMGLPLIDSYASTVDAQTVDLILNGDYRNPDA